VACVSHRYWMPAGSGEVWVEKVLGIAVLG
jgi:hypothetical protein